MTPSALFAALCDPVFDALEDTYPPENFLAQPEHLVFNHVQRGTPDVCYSSLVPLQELPQFSMIVCLFFPPNFQKKSFKNIFVIFNLKDSHVLKDNENIRRYALKVETLVKQGWYNENHPLFILFVMKVSIMDSL